MTTKGRFVSKKAAGGRLSKTPPPESDGCEILYGIHSVLEALLAGRRKIYKIYISQGRTPARVSEIIDRARGMGVEVINVNHDVMEEMSQGLKNQGAVARVSPLPLKSEASLIEGISKHIEGISKQGEDVFFLILDSIEDPHNLGALIRTALCSGVNCVMIPKDRAVSPSPSVSRASAGAMEHADICVVVNTSVLLKKLKKLGFWIAGLDAGGDTPLFKADLTGRLALVVGGEHKGIRPLVRKECDFLLSLPMTGAVTSLNASVAGGIAMYEALRQRCFFP